VQPLIHARNGIADALPFINQLNDALCGWKKVTGKMTPQFLGLFFAEMTLRTAIFWRQFLLAQPVIEMAANRWSINQRRFGDHGSRPAFISKENASYSVTNAQIPAALVQHFQGSLLFRSQMYFHSVEHDPHFVQNQSSSMITDINTWVLLHNQLAN
jgi:hypothetical protein